MQDQEDRRMYLVLRQNVSQAMGGLRFLITHGR
jgi:hypothetical protein